MSSRGPRFDVNILPDSYRGPRLKPRHLLLILALLIIVALMVPVRQAVSGVMDEVSDLKIVRSQLSQQAESNRGIIEERAGMVSLNTEYQIIRDKRGLIVEDLQAITDCEDIVKARIDDFHVTSVTHSGEGQTISVACAIPVELGYTEYKATLKEFTDALTNTGRFAAEPPSLPSSLPTSVTIDIESAEE